MNTNYEDNPKLKTIAEKVLSMVPNAPENFGSVIAVLMIISIILTVIRVMQECNKSKTKNMTSHVKTALYTEEIKSFSKKRGWFTRMRIKLIIKKHLNTEDYNKYAIKLTEALMDVGEDITDDEASTLVEAANV
jgi:hypothetical protein